MGIARLLALLAAVVFCFAPARDAAAQTTALDAATYVGEQACMQCHDTQDKHFAGTLHAKIFRQNPRTAGERQVCEACHGPGSNHVKNPIDHAALIGFTKEWGTPIAVQNAQCMNCHDGEQRLHWQGSAHANGQLGCSDCHNPMARNSTNGLLAKASISETCYRCHQQQEAEFRQRSHMPLPEGKISCVDCHNPHGSPTSPLLKADSINEVCYACHAEKRGPMLWEHAPVRENCINCHKPHGSNNDDLLVAPRPYLCQQCHDASAGHSGIFYNASQTAAAAAQGGAQSPRVINRSCQNCHTQIHGSNSPSGARFQR